MTQPAPIDPMSFAPPAARRRIPATLWIGLAIIMICEIFLFTDLALSHRSAIHSQRAYEQLKIDHPPTTLLARSARLVAVNMTPLAWIGYIIFLEGILTLQSRPRSASPVRTRPHHFALLCLASVVIWCIFDTVNFYSIRAWRYIGMPPDWTVRFRGYLVAFGAIVPGMLMSGQVLMNLGLFDWARVRPFNRSSAVFHRLILPLSLIVGLAMFLWPVLHPNPITNLTLWTSLVFLLDPINYCLGRPSMFRDWQNGWFGRTLAAFSGGLICGFLWEFWNYWALTKWIYRLPFLGAAENFRYFEMPVIGLIGFIPFGIECWIIWQTMRAGLDGLAEPLPDDRTLL